MEEEQVVEGKFLRICFYCSLESEKGCGKGREQGQNQSGARTGMGAVGKGGARNKGSDRIEFRG